MGGQNEPSGLSERPKANGHVGPPLNSIAHTPASVHRSAMEISGCRADTGLSRSMMMPSPALASSSISGLKRMVAPSEPPSPAFLS